ncbi:MAG TPA: hypothetical protein VK821_10315 [Dehalococcoidia bacterium]|nr:hypothetical protein [Dehalococcoidia bacterium]
MASSIVGSKGRGEVVRRERPSESVRWAQRSGLGILALGLVLGALCLVAAYLDGGSWEGRHLVPAAWVVASTQHDPKVPDTSTSPRDQPRSRQFNYGYLWRLDGQAAGR